MNKPHFKILDSFIPGLATKGQLISKCLFGVFNSPKKRTKTIQLEVVKLHLFVCFVIGLKIPKRHFEIN